MKSIRLEHWLKAGLLALLVAGVYHSTLVWLEAKDWGRADYSYGYIIPLVALYLVWEKRGELLALPAAPSWWGFFALAPGLALFWLGELAGEFFTLYLSLWLVVVGLCWIHLGTARLKAIAFPLAILLAMFPPPHFISDGLTLRLKLISSQLGVAAMQAYGLSAFREGNVIDLGFTQLQVVDACSGLRYLFPLLIMGLLLAYFYKAAWWKRAVLVASAVPLTIATNSLRIAATGILYEAWGPAVAEDFFHGFSGWLIFLFGLAVMLLEMWGLNGFRGFGWLGGLKDKKDILAADGRRPAQTKDELATDPHRPTQTKEDGVSSHNTARENTSNHPNDFNQDKSLNDSGLKLNTSSLTAPAPNGWRALLWPPQFIVAAVLLAATLALSQGIEFREKIPPAQSFAGFPLEVGEWSGKRESMEQMFVTELDLSDYVIVDYTAGGKGVNFYTAYYESQRKGESIHSPETCLPGSGWAFRNAGKTVVQLAGRQDPGFGVQGSGSADGGGASAGGRVDGSAITVNRAVMEKGDARQLSYFWFPQRDRVLTNAWELKLYNFWDALTRQRTDGALVRLITPVYPNEDLADADKRLVAFTKEIVPVLNEYLPK
jgi:exosortase